MIAIGGAAGAGAKADSTVDADVAARVDDGAAQIRTTGKTKLTADSSQAASAVARGGGGGGIAVAFLEAYAEVLSDTTAAIGTGATISKAGGVEVAATVLGAPAYASVTVGSGGGIDIAGTTRPPRSKPSGRRRRSAIGVRSATSATRGAGGPITGDVTVTATGRGEADATGTASGGGVVRVGSPSATRDGEAEGRRAHRHDDADVRSTVIVTTGSIKVTCRAEEDRCSDARRHDPVRRHHPRHADVQLPVDHRGRLVRYSRQRGRVCTTTRLHRPRCRAESHPSRLAVRGHGIDPPLDTITFRRGTALPERRLRLLDPRGRRLDARRRAAGDASGGCTNRPPTRTKGLLRPGHQQTTIKLTTTYTAATAADDAPYDVTVSDSTHLQFSSLPAGIAVGTAVMYQSPFYAGFTSGLVDATVSGDSITHSDALDNIYVGTDALVGVNTGDAVRYLTLSGTSIGLTSGGTYYVIKHDDGTIQLADSYCHAVGTCVDTHGTATTDDDTIIPVTPLALTHTSDGDRHSIERSIAGLSDRHTYYVVSVSGNTVELSATRGGTPISGLTADNRPGPHGIGIVEVDLVAVSGNDQQALFANLSSAGSGTQRLLAPSGDSLSTIAPPPGDGISGASAQGGSGGIGSFAFPVAKLTGSPSVTATLAALRLDAGDDVELHADSTFAVQSNADTTGGGAVSIGKAVARTDLGQSPTSATVAPNSVITAGGDVWVKATNDHTIASSARSAGGGAIAGKIAYSYAFVDNDVTATIGTDADITAYDSVRVQVDSKTAGNTHSTTYTVGVGAGADSDDTSDDKGVAIGTASDNAHRRGRHRQRRQNHGAHDRLARAGLQAGPEGRDRRDRLQPDPHRRRHRLRRLQGRRLLERARRRERELDARGHPPHGLPGRRHRGASHRHAPDRPATRTSSPSR